MIPLVTAFPVPRGAFLAPRVPGGHPTSADKSVDVGYPLLYLGAVALMKPLSADPLVIRLHAPYLAGCIVIVAALLSARRLGRRWEHSCRHYMPSTSR
ncbi:MAG TPA: hypothetical protein VFO18_16385 [Methylomirabilota bacterium]|nr:hypothetical protein [Methylomirabilota bacterium]